MTPELIESLTSFIRFIEPKVSQKALAAFFAIYPEIRDEAYTICYAIEGREISYMEHFLVTVTAFRAAQLTQERLDPADKSKLKNATNPAFTPESLN